MLLTIAEHASHAGDAVGGGGVGTPGGKGVGRDGIGIGLPGRTVIVTVAWSSIWPWQSPPFGPASTLA